MVRSWSSPLLPPIKPMLLANRRLHMGLRPMEIHAWCSWSVSCTTVSRNKLNRIVESEHPWHKSIAVFKDSPSWGFKRTALLEFPNTSWIAWTSLSSAMTLLKTCHNPACQTVSNAFLKSKKLWNRSRICWVLLYDDSIMEDLFYCAGPRKPGLNPACFIYLFIYLFILCQQFLSLGLGSIKENLEHDLAGMVD